MAGSPAQQTAQHVAPAFIGGHDAVGNHKGTRFNMVRHNPEGNIRLMILLILLARQLADTV